MTETQKYALGGLAAVIVAYIVTRPKAVAAPVKSVVPNRGVTSSVVNPAAASSQISTGTISSLLSSFSSLLGLAKSGSGGSTGSGGGKSPGSGCSGGGSSRNTNACALASCPYNNPCPEDLCPCGRCSRPMCLLNGPCLGGLEAPDATLGASCQISAPDCSFSNGCNWTGPANSCTAGCLQGCGCWGCYA